VGTGIVTGNGADPLIEWKARLAWLGSETLSNDVRRLLSGQLVLSVDGELEISSLPLADGSGATMLTVRRFNAPYVAEIVVLPIPNEVIVNDRDGRNPIPAPDQWRVIIPDGVQWELFNCRVATLKSRAN
jgi:hypothetical protein